MYNGGTAHVWATVGVVVADKPALKRIFECMGANGVRPCLMCANVFWPKLRWSKYRISWNVLGFRKTHIIFPENRIFCNE